MIKRGHGGVIAASRRSHICAQAPKYGVEVLPFYFQKKNLLSFWKKASLIDREKIEIVNTHTSSDSWISSLAARLSRRKPQIIRTRHLSTPISKSFLSRLIYSNLPAAIITAGEEIRRKMIQDNGFDLAKIFSIPTGLDLDRFDPERIKPAFRVVVLCTNPLLRERLGNVDQQMVRHSYSLERMPDRIEDLYAKLWPSLYSV